MKKLFSKEIFIHFGKADPQGILYNAHIQELAHEVFEEYIASTPIGWSGWYRSAEFAVPMRHLEQDFYAPIHAGTKISATLFLVEMGESSLQTRVDFYVAGEKLAASAKAVQVFVSQKDFKKIAIPTFIKEILNQK